MKTQRIDREQGEAPRAGRRADEGGFLLVLVMVVMLVLSTIAASTLINSFLQRSLSKNQNYASIALQAAEAGLAAGYTWLRENTTALPEPYTSNPTWSVSFTRNFDRDLNADGAFDGPGEKGGEYTVTLRFLREWRDVNGDGDCLDPGETSPYTDNVGTVDAGLTQATVCPGDIVLYNSCTNADNCFNFGAASLFSGTPGDEGYPVIEIDSRGTYGSGSQRQVSLLVARNKINLQVNGAITARSNVTVSGSGYVDGHNYNMAGTAPSSTCFDLPGVTVDTGLTAATDDDPSDDANCGTLPGGNPKGIYGGSPCSGVYDESVNGPLGVYAGETDPAYIGKVTPWGMMQISKANFDTIFGSPAVTEAAALAKVVSGSVSSPTYVYQPGDMNFPSGDGFGMLVVHNPLYDPAQWETLCPGGVTGAGYCTAANGPATLSMNGTVNFTGVIVADQILRVNGTTTTIGAVLSIGGLNVDGGVTGNWAIKYSCEAIEKALAGFGYGTKIAWHRLR